MKSVIIDLMRHNHGMGGIKHSNLANDPKSEKLSLKIGRSAFLSFLPKGLSLYPAGLLTPSADSVGTDLPPMRYMRPMVSLHAVTIQSGVDQGGILRSTFHSVFGLFARVVFQQYLPILTPLPDATTEQVAQFSR
jgi:hypothetical protein